MDADAFKAEPLPKTPLPRRAWVALSVEALTSLGASQLMMGIFFFTKQELGWETRHNLLLAASQGFVYIFAALSSEPLSRRLRRRGTVGVASGLCAVAAVFALLARHSSLWIAVALLVYTIISTVIWPVLEGIVTSDCGAHEMGRRVGIYNLVWSAVNMSGVALVGTLLAHWPAGVFIVPILSHSCALLIILLGGRLESGKTASHAHAEPEPELVRVRKLAMWLSRIALPATYMVAYAMMAIMPTLPVIQSLPTSLQTLVGSVWLMVRWIGFLTLGATLWWHTRPIWLLGATAVMLVAFFGITIRLGDITFWLAQIHVSPLADLLFMVGWQCALGLAVALIYAGSLYFGMVLSEGSTEHGGYHEALIGVGAVLGPGSGALAEWIHPGKAWVSVAAVGSVITLTLVAAALASIRARRDIRADSSAVKP